MATQIDYSKNNKPCLYHRMYFNYQVGLGKIYSEEEIREAQRSPSFPREYDLQWLGLQGNVFSSYDIDKAIELGEKYKDLPVNQYNLKIAGLDPGFSSSKTALYVGEFLKEEKCIRIIYGKEFDKETPSRIADIVHELHRKHMNFYCYIDGSNRSLVNELKYKFGENVNWDKPEDVFPQSSKILPVNFATSHKSMLEHLHSLISKGKVAIPKEYELLIIALRTCVAEEWSMKKDESVNSDSLDSLRLLCVPFKFGVRS